MSEIGLDVGTSFLVSARQVGSDIQYRHVRDAFLRIHPQTVMAAKILEKSLKQSQEVFVVDDVSGTPDYIVLGQDAIVRAVNRKESALRPLHRGVVSPREPDARRILKWLLTELLGKGEGKLVYTIPAAPVDESVETFDVGYHERALASDLRELGYDPTAIYEATALGYSELEAESYSGLLCSCGAGMCNVSLLNAGECITSFSIAKGGDWIDRMSAVATNLPDSEVQMEKENGDFTVGEKAASPVLDVVATNYVRLIDYLVQVIAHQLRNPKSMPRFQEAIPCVVAGGTSKAKGFVDAFRVKLLAAKLPIEISEVRSAREPLWAVARGCLVAASL